MILTERLYPAILVGLAGATVLCALSLGVACAVLPAEAVLVIAILGSYVTILVALRSVVVTAVIVSGTVDLFTNVELGPVSAMGLLTIGYCLAACLVLGLGRLSATRGLVVSVLPLIALMAWGAASMFLWHSPSVVGAQNLASVGAFVSIILLAASACRKRPEVASRIGEALLAATWVASTLFIAVRLTEGWSSLLDMHPRSYSLFALLGLSWCVAGWRGGTRGNLVGAGVLVLLIGLSLSRTALVIGASLPALAQILDRSSLRWVKMPLLGVLVLTVLYMATLTFTPLASRFWEGDFAVRVGDLTLNTAGRMKFWETTFASFSSSPWIGRGPGSAQQVIEAAFPGLGHPHNDYLRVLHDYGIIGFALWMVGIGGLVSRTYLAWERGNRFGPVEARAHGAAFLAVVALSVTMVTDNTLVYAYIMVPLGALIGASLGLISRRARAPAGLHLAGRCSGLCAMRASQPTRLLGKVLRKH